MADPNQNPGGGLGPPGPLGGPSLDAEEKAMRSGRGRMLAVMILAVVAAVGGLVLDVGGRHARESRPVADRHASPRRFAEPPDLPP